MKLKLPISLLFLLFFTILQTFAEGEKPAKNKKKKKARTATFVEKKVETFSFKKSGELIQNENSAQEMIQAFGGDPILFSISTKNKTAAIGETVEIKVIAQLMDAAAANYFVFEELKGYTLKVVMPKNFIQTGGTYYDYVRDELTPSKNRIEYSIIGKFEGECTGCEFKVLRGKLGAGPDDSFVLKDMQIVNSNEKKSSLAFSKTIPSKEILNFSSENYSVTVQKPLLDATFCETNSYSVPNAGRSTFGNGTCVSHVSSPKWFIVQVTSPGKMKMKISSANNDIDFVCWGPYKNTTLQNVRNKTLTDLGIIQDQSFDPSIVEFCNFGYTQSLGGCFPNPSRPDAEVGYYAILVSNFGSTSTTISFENIFPNTGAAVTNCGAPAPNNCSNINNPTVSLFPSSITQGERFKVSVSSCNGTVKWYKNNALLDETASEFYTGTVATYKAVCNYSECPTNPDRTSNSVTPALVPLRISHSIPNNEVIAGQLFELQAIGCNAGKIEWLLPDGSTRFPQNPTYVQGAGLYKARCVNELDNSIFSAWVTETFTLKAANRPVISKSNNLCIYDNQTVLVSATCPSGMSLTWWNGTSTTVFPSYQNVTPGNYWAKCCNGSNCSANESFTICLLNPTIGVINTNKEDPTDRKTYANPTEPVLLTATGCEYGTIQWDYNGTRVWGNPITVYGPGNYYARCFVTEKSWSDQVHKQIFLKPPGAVTIISSLASAHSNQLLTLTAQGCSNGFVEWTYVVNGVTKRETGHTIDVLGPNAYTAYCISFGITSIPSTISIPQAPSNAPKIIVEKTRVRPNETFTFKVDYSGCLNRQWWGGQTLVTQNGVTRVLWGLSATPVTGPAILEAQCADRPWDKQTREIFFAPADNLKLIANKNKAKANPNEAVLLTTYGCDYGFIEWQIGDARIMGSIADPKRQITQYGPGYYKARCRDDFSINTDWVTVFVEADGSVTPLINGPARMCPNTATTITTPGCPYGYYNVWNTLENGGWSYGGNSITIYSPQTVKLRCNKDDNSFASEEKSLVIEPAFPDDVKAKNNGPVVLGSTAIITATEVTGATYLWTVPTGVTFPSLTTKSLQAPNATEAYAGEYSVRITFNGCAINAKTTLAINSCDNLYIKAFNPLTNAETNKLIRKPNVAAKNEYEDLILQVETLDGKIIKTMDYTWTPPAGVTLVPNPNEPYKRQTNKLGRYTVQARSANGTNCPLSIDIFAEPCTIVGDAFNCNSTGGSTIDANQTDLANLAVGDEFTTSDYTIVVTEASKTGTTFSGKGKLIFNFLKISNTLALQIPISVTFTGIKINQCYQLYSGSVITEYDESWGSVVDIKNSYTSINKSFQNVLDFLNTYTGTAEQKSQLELYITEINNQIGKIESDTEISPLLKSEFLAEISKVSTSLVCLKNSYNPNGRLSETCSVDQAIAQVNQSSAVIAPVIVWAIRKGGECLLAASLDIAVQYVLEGSLLWLDGKVNNLGEFSKIWPSVSYLQAGGTCLESIFGCTICSASINGLVSIGQSLTAEYNKHGEDVEDYNWAGIGTNLFVDVAASYIGNVAGQELSTYFARYKSKIAQQGYHQTRASLRKFLPDNLADMLMHKASGLLSSAGKFADNVLESQYTAYVTRKAKNGGSAKDRLTWLEAVEYFQNKTSIPRGNAFNKKYKTIYDFNEITLWDGKRIDSYVPPANGKRGEIISRKATELVEIDINTFKSYLSEMKSKYSPPKKINQTTVNNNPGIGTEILGDMYLDIPLTNSGFSDLENYKNIAKTYGITLRLVAE